MQYIAVNHKPQRQFFASPFCENLQVTDLHPKTQLVANLLRLMAARPGLDSAEALSRRCFWPAGKKRGRQIAPRTIRYVFDTSDESPSPTLDVLVGIANALQCQPWELIVSDERTRMDILAKILGANPADAKNIPLAPENLPPPKRTSKKRAPKET